MEAPSRRWWALAVVIMVPSAVRRGPGRRLVVDRRPASGVHVRSTGGAGDLLRVGRANAFARSRMAHHSRHASSRHELLADQLGDAQLLHQLHGPPVSRTQVAIVRPGAAGAAGTRIRSPHSGSVGTRWISTSP